VAEAITEDAAWYCWHTSRRQAMLEACWEKAGAFVHQQIIWVKDRGVFTRSHYLWKHEPCFMGWWRPNRPPKVAEQTLPSTWEMPSFAKDERPDHPTPKPLDAFGTPMRQHVARGGLCYEPFSGSGSQIMAGEANGRRVFAMEISPAYVDVAVQRWQAGTGREAKGAGGFGHALELMGNLAGAVWDGIKAVASPFVDDFRSIKASVEQLWLKLMAFLSNKWADFLATIGPTFNSVAETLGTDARIDWFGAQSTPRCSTMPSAMPV